MQFTFNHTNLNVADLEKSIRFYEEALGLKVSQFVGLMGDTPVSAREAADAASQARRHVERLVQELCGDATEGACL